MKLKDQTRFYYLRGNSYPRFGRHNPGNHPFGCVCLKVIKGRIWRGISLCSPKDQFTKEVGRGLAEMYATFCCHATLFSEENNAEHKFDPVWKRTGISLPDFKAHPHQHCILSRIGNLDLWDEVRFAEDTYDLKDIFRDTAPTPMYVKAREETWNTLTEYERHIFESAEKNNC